MSREKLNIQFRIRAVDNFSKTMNKLHVRLESVKRHADSISDKTLKVDVVGDKRATRQLSRVERKARKMTLKAYVMRIKVDSGNALKTFRRDMGRIATLSRDIGEIIGRTLTSALITMSSTGVASLGALVAVAGSLGPMIGSLAGGVFGLATAFGAAGAAAVGFGAVAFPAIKRVIDANSELKQLQEDLAKASSESERAEILKQIADITDGLSESQLGALDSMNKVADTFNKLSKAVEPQSLYVFTQMMGLLENLMVRLTPMIESAADVAVKLADSLGFNMQSSDFNAFIDFLNKSASPIMQDIVEGIGNFAMGVINMMTAFGPASEIIAGGFNDMGRRFREWAAGLSESERFQAFIDYILKEGPKVLSVIGGITQVMVDMFAAFGPLASDMLDGLLELIEGWKEWARTLDQNPEFIEFTEWVRSHGPELLDFFGEFRDFLINLAKGFGQVSETITPIITKFFEFSNRIMETNPWIAQLVAWLITLGGVAMNGAIFLRILQFAFKLVAGPVKQLWKVFKQLWKVFKQFILPIFQTAWGFIKRFLIPIITRIGTVFLRILPFIVRAGAVLAGFISGPVGWVILAVTMLAEIIFRNWDSIWKWTKEKWEQVSEWTKEKWGEVKKWITEKVTEAIAVGSLIWSFVQRILNYFRQLGQGVKERMSKFVKFIKDPVGEAREWLASQDWTSLGANLVQGIIRGITGTAGRLADAAKNAASRAYERAKNFLGIKSPSRLFMEVGRFTGEGFIIGMEKTFNGIEKASEYMAGSALPSNNSLQFQGIKPINPATSSPGVAGSTTLAEERIQVIEVPVYLDGREIARATVDDITEIQDRRKTISGKFRGGAYI